MKTMVGKAEHKADAELKDKVKDVLNEARILVLGVQVLLGFQFQAIFSPGFQRLAVVNQWGSLACLSLELMALALLLAPAPYHRIAEDGDDTANLKHLTANLIAVALPLLAFALGLDAWLVSAGHIGEGPAFALGGSIVMSALAAWVVIGMANRKGDGRPGNRRVVTPLNEKIRTLLTETRVILPGVQALLGFQFSAVLTEKFDRLPEPLKAIHLGSLLLIAISIILLIAPAAYHRLAADGEARADVDSFGARAALGALVPLAGALCGDLYIVVAIQSGSTAWAAGGAMAALFGFAVLWGVIPVKARRARAGT